MRKITQGRLNKILLQHEPDWYPRGGIKKKPRTNLQNVDLENFDLSGVDLPDANFEMANLKNIDFSGANLRSAKMYRTNLQRADLTKANLRLADLEFANLEGANLTRAWLSATNLHKANFFEANLELADLTKANLCQTIGNGREILTVYADGYHVNITDDIVWIDRRCCPWETWVKLNDSQFINVFQGSRCISSIDRIMKEKTLDWWCHWKPKLSKIIEKRKHQRDAMTHTASRPRFWATKGQKP